MRDSITMSFICKYVFIWSFPIRYYVMMALTRSTQRLDQSTYFHCITTSLLLLYVSSVTPVLYL